MKPNGSEPFREFPFYPSCSKPFPAKCLSRNMVPTFKHCASSLVIPRCSKVLRNVFVFRVVPKYSSLFRAVLPVMMVLFFYVLFISLASSYFSMCYRCRKRRPVSNQFLFCCNCYLANLP